jgi:hypothetical protein
MSLYKELERYEMERAALSLAHTGTLGNVYGIPTGPSAQQAAITFLSCYLFQCRALLIAQYRQVINLTARICEMKIVM